MSYAYIGRVGRGAVQLDGISSWEINGRVVKFTGVIHAAGATSGPPTATQLAQVLAERQRLAGYVTSFDEPVVPILWTCDPSQTGFYRILDINIGFDGPAMYTGLFPFTVDAEQVVGYASPQFEVNMSGASITNPHAITGDSWFAFPEAVTEQYYRDDCTLNVLRTSATGVLNFTTCNIRYSGTLRYYLRPADFYVGGCSISVGNPLELTVGTQIPDSPLLWQIDNGLVRVSASGSPGRILVSHYDGTQWDSAKEYTLAGTEPHNSPASPKQAGAINNFATLSILRNSPETVAIRLSCVTEFGITFGRVYLDIRLRRGDRMAVCTLTSDTAQQWKVRRTNGEAATAITGGIRATSNDASGNRYVIGTSSAFTSNLVVGQITQTSALRAFYFGLGSEIGGSSAVTTAVGTELIEQLMAGQTERLIVSSR